MIRITLHLPKKVSDKLDDEAKKRLSQMNMSGSLGGTKRDILCILFCRHINEIQKMSPDEYEKALRDMRRDTV